MGEELFFRDVARRQLADALSPTAILTQQALYIAVTTATGIPIPFVASILIFSTTPHLVWSIGMAFLFAGGYWIVGSGPPSLERRELAVHSRSKQSAT